MKNKKKEKKEKKENKEKELNIFTEYTYQNIDDCVTIYVNSEGKHIGYQSGKDFIKFKEENEKQQ